MKVKISGTVFGNKIGCGGGDCFGCGRMNLGSDCECNVDGS